MIDTRIDVPCEQIIFFSNLPCAESFDRVTDIHVDSLFTLGETTNKQTTRISATLMVKKKKRKARKKQWKERKLCCPMNKTSSTIDKLSNRDWQY